MQLACCWCSRQSPCNPVYFGLNYFSRWNNLNIKQLFVQIICSTQWPNVTLKLNCPPLHYISLGLTTSSRSGNLTKMYCTKRKHFRLTNWLQFNHEYEVFGKLIWKRKWKEMKWSAFYHPSLFTNFPGLIWPIILAIIVCMHAVCPKTIHTNYWQYELHTTS